AGKAFHLPPDLFRNVLGIAGCPAMVKELVVNFIQVFFASVLARHHTPQHVRIRKIQSPIVVADLHHVLLVHHHSVGFFQLFPHHRVQVLDLGWISVPFDISFHHAGGGNSGPDNGGG